ncbi:MAG TPA: hypothetical protein VGC14_01120, partial [Rhizobium sp.]
GNSHPALLDQLHRLKLELTTEYPALHPHPSDPMENLISVSTKPAAAQQLPRSSRVIYLIARTRTDASDRRSS